MNEEKIGKTLKTGRDIVKQAVITGERQVDLVCRWSSCRVLGSSAMGKRIWVQAIATLLWLVSAVLGMIAILQVYEATRAVAAFVIPVDPLQTVASGMQAVFVARVALIILAIGWLSVAILLLEQYHDAAAEPRRLARRFFMTTTIELAVIGLATAIIYVLPGLALGVTL